VIDPLNQNDYLDFYDMEGPPKKRYDKDADRYDDIKRHDHPNHRGFWGNLKARFKAEEDLEEGLEEWYNPINLDQEEP